MARRPARRQAGCLSSVGNTASAPGWWRAAGGDRWIQAKPEADRASTAAPTSPASGPGSMAAASGGTTRWAAATRLTLRSASRAGESNRSPAAETPPPDDHDAGVEGSGEPGDADPEPVADQVKPPPRPGRPRGPLRDHRTGKPPGRPRQLARARPAGRRGPGPRASACPLAYCSQHPRRRTRTRGPPGTTFMCPNSPAIPLWPRSTRRRSREAPPMPVPSVTIRPTWCRGRAVAPLRPGPRSWRRCRRLSGTPSRSATRPHAARPRHGRCGANMTRSPARRRTRGRQPEPASRSPPARQPASTTASSTSRGSTWSAGRRAAGGATHLAVASTTPASTLVPPTSTPTQAGGWVMPRSPRRHPGEVGGADEPGRVAQHGQADLEDRAGTRGR